MKLLTEIFLEKQFASQMRWASSGDDGDDLDVAEGPLLLQAGVAEGGLCQEEEEAGEVRAGDSVSVWQVYSQAEESKEAGCVRPGGGGNSGAGG